LAIATTQPDSPFEPAHNPVTVRAVLLGLVTITVSTLYMDHHAGNLVKSYLPVAVLIPFLGWVVLNTILRLTVPRAALTHSELLTIFAMIWVSGNMPAVGWAQHAVSLMPAPDFYASPENRVREVIIPHLPKWLFLEPSADPSIRQVYTGIPTGDAVPWMKWFRPFFWWLVGCVGALMAALFCSVLFFKQWDEQERLVFPMSTFPVDMLASDEDGIPHVFKDKIYWIGFLCVFGIIGWNILGYFAISLPRITLFDLANTKEISLGHYYPPFYLRVQPLLMGLAYLCPTDILFSFWAYNILNTFKIGMMNRTGFTIGLEGQPAKAGEIAMLESNGALFLLVGWSLWISRHHLAYTLRVAFKRPPEEDDGAPVSYRTAWIGFGMSTLILAGWCMSAGLTVGATLMQLIFMFVCYFGISKYAATTGFTFLNPAGGKGYGVIRSIGGSVNLTPASQAMMILIQRNVFLGAPLRTASIPMIPHYFRMLGKNLRRVPAIWLIIPLAFVFGWWLAAGSRLGRAYAEGGLNTGMVPWAVDELVGNLPFIDGSKAHVFDYQRLGVWLFGAGEAAVLTVLRFRFSWWPLHPIAIAFPERRYAFCLMLVWLAKVATLKFGGVGMYRRSLPFWYGAISGYLFGIALSSVIDVLLFPDGGHGVHGW
jgi:hypothetical protein